MMCRPPHGSATAEDFHDEMASVDEVDVGRYRVQAGDAIPSTPFVEDHPELPAGQWYHEALGCPSPSRRAQRMRPSSAQGYHGGCRRMPCTDISADVTLKQPLVPMLCIPEPGEAVQGQYEECDSESDNEDLIDDDDEPPEWTQSLKPSSRFLQKSDAMACDPGTMTGLGNLMNIEAMTGKPVPAPDVAEPRGSSARPPRAKGSHSLEVGPSDLPRCHGMGGPQTLSKVSMQDQA